MKQPGRVAKRRKRSLREPDSEPGKGLFRTTLAGPGRTLDEAFRNLEKVDLVERVCRHRSRDLFGGRVNLAEDEGRGHWDFTRIRNEIFVVIGDFAYKDPRVEILSGDGMIQFYFKLSGDLTMALTRAESLNLSQPGLLIYHQPSGVEVREWTAPSVHERFACINVRPDVLAELFASHPAMKPDLLGELMGRNSGRAIYCRQLPLSAEMFELATKLVDRPYDGSFDLIYTEALIMQLVCLAVARLGALPEAPSEQYSPREVQCLHAARKFLMSRLDRPPTIREVARAAGLSETRLKYGFKDVFGETVFDFSVRCRMQHALALLREQRIPVSEVGAAVGYSHQTSFATAFRRHFGLRPKDVRPGRTR